MTNYNLELLFDPELPDSMNSFINYLQNIKNSSEDTISAYTKDLRIFFRFMKLYKNPELKDISFNKIKISDIDNDFLRNIKLNDLYAYMSFLEKFRGNGVYARSRKVASIKSFFKYIYTKEKIIEHNPALELESPKIEKRHPIYLTLSQSKFLLNSLNRNNPNYERDYCILILFMNCGMRISELCSIKISNIKEDTLTIIGKGNKERTVYLNNACLKAIKNYMKVRDDSKVKNEEDKNYLFLSQHSKPINVRTVEIMVKKHILNAGLVDKHYTPHKLRHTAATLIYKYGSKDIVSLQNILGHENISTTQLYTHVDDDSLRKVANSNPLADF